MEGGGMSAGLMVVLNISFTIIMLLGWAVEFRGTMHLLGTVGVWVTSLLIIYKCRKDL